LDSVTALLLINSHHSKPNPYAKLGTDGILNVNTVFDYRHANNLSLKNVVGNV